MKRLQTKFAQIYCKVINQYIKERSKVLFGSLIQKAHYGKMENPQYAQCVQYLSSRNMKTKNVSRDTFQKIRVDQLSPNPNQVRIDFDKAGLVELVALIKATGLLRRSNRARSFLTEVNGT